MGWKYHHRMEQEEVEVLLEDHLPHQVEEVLPLMQEVQEEGRQPRLMEEVQAEGHQLDVVEEHQLPEVPLVLDPPDLKNLNQQNP